MSNTHDNNELLNQIEAARRAAELSPEPRAVEAGYLEETGEVFVHLDNGFYFRFPAEKGQGLAGADPEQLAEVEITPSGKGLHWETLDADLSIPDLLNGIYGTRKWMQELGKRGGASTSPAKAAAARFNGKKGGRPRKHPKA